MPAWLYDTVTAFGLWLYEWAWIVAALVATILVLAVILYRTRYPHRNSRKENRRRDRLHHGKRVGIYLSPVETNLILRPILSLFAGQVVGWLLYLLAVGLGSAIFPWWAAGSLGVLLAIFFGLNDEKELEVPKAHVAIVTFLGLRFRIYLEEGTHYWFAQRIGFSYSADPLPNTVWEKEKLGFVFVGKRQLQIYERTEADKKQKDLTLKNVTSNSSEVSVQLTVAVTTMDPLAWANSTDPVLDVAERARSALRTIVSFFTGIDNAVMKSAFSKLMGGHKLIAAFTKEPRGVHPRGSVVQNPSGTLIFETLLPDASTEAVEEAKALLRQRINDEADPAMVKSLSKDKDGNIRIEEREVEEHLVGVMDAVGAHFDHASASNFSLSEEVSRQANIAEGENFQRTGQVLSAKTIAETSEIIAKAKKANGEDSEFAVMAALAKDGHAEIKYILVPGADRLTRAAVAGASQITK
jgi:hypothetical protein